MQYFYYYTTGKVMVLLFAFMLVTVQQLVCANTCMRIPFKYYLLEKTPATCTGVLLLASVQR